MSRGAVAQASLPTCVEFEQNHASIDATVILVFALPTYPYNRDNSFSRMLNGRG